MPRPDRSQERREELLPIIARTFAELGYRRTTTAVLARRCDVQETTLYRLWADKKAMFLASIDHVFALSLTTWTERAATGGHGSHAEKVLAYEAEHLGEFGLYRILFAGIGEADDPQIRAAVSSSYRRFQRWIEDEVRAHRGRFETDVDKGVDPAQAAWAAVGLGIIVSIGRELELFADDERSRLLSDVGRLLLSGGPR